MSTFKFIAVSLLGPPLLAFALLLLAACVLLVCVTLAPVCLLVWPLAPFALLPFKLKPRKNYGRVKVSDLVHRTGPHPVETCACPICAARRVSLGWPEPQRN